MKPFKAWIIANVWEIISFIAVIVAIIWSCNVNIDTNRWTLVPMSIVIVLLLRNVFGGVPSKNIVTTIMNNILVLVFVVVSILFIYHKEEFLVDPLLSTLYKASVAYLIGGGIGLVLAVMAAIYTWRNIDEVISLRLLYRNSQVDLFSIKLQYVYDRFVAVWSSIAFIIVLIFLAVKLFTLAS